MRSLLVYFVFLILCGCGFVQNDNQPSGFYEQYSEWDVKYIPIIPPFKAVSAYPEVWLIDVGNQKVKQNDHTYGDISVLSFGVSDCYVFGTQPEGYSPQIANWFLFDTKTLGFESFKNESEFTNALNDLNIEIADMLSCESYFNHLTDGQKCYWFPETGVNEYLDCR